MMAQRRALAPGDFAWIAPAVQASYQEVLPFGTLLLIVARKRSHLKVWDGTMRLPFWVPRSDLQRKEEWEE